MSTKRKKKGRKRKQPDTFNEDIPSQPRSKKRKLSIPPHNKRTSKTTNDKSQSTSPKISKSSPNPYKNTTIPTLTFNNNKSKLSRRRTTYSNDDSTDDEDNLSSPESSETHYNTKLLKYNTIRSQPSTPIHKIKSNNDKKGKEPHSQSAKRSKTTKKYYTIKPSNNTNTNTYTYDSSLSPPPALGNNTDRKAMALLLESQESLAFSPPRNNKPKMRSMNVQITHKTPKRNMNHKYSHVIPVNATPLRTQYGNNNTLQMDNMNNSNRSNNNMQIENDNTMPIESVYNTHRHSHGETQAQHNSNQPPDTPVANKNSKWWNNDILYILLFVLFGFICGFSVSVAANRQHTYPKATTMINNRYNIIDTDQCTCDIDSNSTSRLCSPCMDQYWNLKTECDENNNIQLKKERDELILEKKKLENELKKKNDDVNVDGCILRLNHLENEMNECKNITNELENKIQQLQNSKMNCDEYEEKIGELEHELGECNVEWGSCEQLGRQKDKLDEKRLEEIKKQKHKFSLCNEQLKRYKEAAKKNKGR